MLFARGMRILPYQHLQCRLGHSTTTIVRTEELSDFAYKPESVERNRYSKWESDGLFRAENSNHKEIFSMVLPPPNVTGKLHLGHALACTVQDVMVRRQRSLGKNVLWLPGTDHAGIATQGVVEKYLQRTQNIDRLTLGRSAFNAEVMKWKDQHGDEITKQLKMLGASLDWSREVFTMDENHTQAVNHAFIQLFQKGLIYRRKALVNWCSTLKSTVSDIEVDSLPLSEPTSIQVPDYESPVKFGLLYNFAYRILDSNEELVVSTTMPETMLGDTAIAVHPHDRRYSHLVGRRAIHPFLNKTIPIIFDDFVDMNFGTGAVKITPGHSKIDYDIGRKHKLPLIQVINEDGRMVNSEHFNNMKRYECRTLLIQTLDDLGLFKGMKPHQMTLPICSRTGVIIHHLPKEQWFLSCKELNEKASELVTSGTLKIEPEKFVRNWLDWTGDSRDWCISRQLWWGHQIPAYKCTTEHDCIWLAGIDPDAAKLDASMYLRTLPENIKAERDTDVLDTWFSSGIYPFAALGWPNEYSVDYQNYFPLSVLATGHDILGFWVHRMVILSLVLTGKVPFDKVFLHGIVCDAKGAKMSKSKGNVIDPLDVIHGITLEGLSSKVNAMYQEGVLSKDECDKAKRYHRSNFSNTNGIPACGVDALRFSLLSSDVKSHYVNFNLDLCMANKLFCNKIWQSIKYSRLAYMRLPPLDDLITTRDLGLWDKWILSRMANMVDTVNTSIDNYNFHIATKSLKTFLYNEFCDFYIEATKPAFANEDIRQCYAHAHTLTAVLNTSLRCLAPFMVYLTEELLPKIPRFDINIICNYNDDERNLAFPAGRFLENWQDQELEDRVNNVINSIFLVRQLKGFYNISNKARPVVSIITTDEKLKENLEESTPVFLNMTKSDSIVFEPIDDDNRRFVSAPLNKDTLINVELVADNVEDVLVQSRTRLQKKIMKVEEAMARLQKQFQSQNYLTTVPEWTQILDREKLMNKKEELKHLKRFMDGNAEGRNCGTY